MLLSLFGVAGLTPFGALPLVFAVFGLWLVAVAFIMPPPVASYAAPREMVLGWGAILTGLGTLWYVGFANPTALPVVFTVFLVVAGIGIVGYALMRAGSKKGSSLAV